MLCLWYTLNTHMFYMCYTLHIAATLKEDIREYFREEITVDYVLNNYTCTF